MTKQYLYAFEGCPPEFDSRLGNKHVFPDKRNRFSRVVFNKCVVHDWYVSIDRCQAFHVIFTMFEYLQTKTVKLNAIIIEI